jgi:hypothetical protein
MGSTAPLPMHLPLPATGTRPPQTYKLPASKYGTPQPHAVAVNGNATLGAVTTYYVEQHAAVRACLVAFAGPRAWRGPRPAVRGPLMGKGPSPRRPKPSVEQA